MGITSINPANGKPIETYAEMTPEEAAAAVAEAHERWRTWRTTSFAARATLMKKTAAFCPSGSTSSRSSWRWEWQAAETSVAEPRSARGLCDYYADSAESHLAPDVIKTESSKSYVAFEPLGIVLAIMPWNFPFWQVYRFAAPALMAGNAGVLKHASNVPQCALAIEKIFTQAGFPPGVFRTLLIGNKQVRAVIEDPLVRAVT